jgi:hypothetical protein
MRKPILALSLIALTAFSGCARHYVITLDNGRHITTSSKPKLHGQQYEYKDGEGKKAYVGSGRVREIAPASMAGENKSMFNPQPIGK